MTVLNIGQLQGISPTNEILVASDTKLIVDGTLRVNNIQNSFGIQIYGYAANTNTFYKNLTVSNISSEILSPSLLVSPIWTSTTRPVSPQVGTIGYNSTSRILEVWNGTEWKVVKNTTQSGTGGLFVNEVPSTFTTGTAIDLNTPGTYTIRTTSNISVQWYMWGAGGGGTQRSASITGGGGGYTKGIFNLIANTNYIAVVGGGGGGGASGSAGTPGAGGSSGSFAGVGNLNDGGGGGGYSGLFSGTISFANAIMIAGGGGGGSGDTANGGGGGGTTGGNASNSPGRGGSGGSQSSGGSGGTDGGTAQSGSQLQGGNGNGVGAGGGGGYYGGGGGSPTGPGAGGGGSALISGSVQSGSTTVGNSPGTAANPDGNIPVNVGSGGSSGGSGQRGHIRLVAL